MSALGENDNIMAIGILFLLVAAVCAGYAWLLGDGFWILLWPAISCALVATGYLGWGARVFGKRNDGTRTLLLAIVHFPYFAMLHAAWRLARLVRRHPAYQQLLPNVTIGRRLLPHEFPADTELVIDLTSEFPASVPRRPGVGYYCLPILDRGIPEPGAAASLCQRILDSKQHVYLHCAEGHGRTGIFASLLVLGSRQAPDADSALAIVKSVRPGVRLTRQQSDFVSAAAQQMSARAPHA